MSKTYRRDEQRRPKWDKSGYKSKKYRELGGGSAKRKDWGTPSPKKRGPDFLGETDSDI